MLFIFLICRIPALIIAMGVLRRVAIAENSLLIDAGVNVELTPRKINLRLAYIGQWANKVHDNGVTGVVTWTFA